MQEYLKQVPVRVHRGHSWRQPCQVQHTVQVPYVKVRGSATSGAQCGSEKVNGQQAPALLPPGSAAALSLRHIIMYLHAGHSTPDFLNLPHVTLHTLPPSQAKALFPCVLLWYFRVQVKRMPLQFNCKPNTSPCFARTACRVPCLRHHKFASVAHCM